MGEEFIEYETKTLSNRLFKCRIDGCADKDELLAFLKVSKDAKDDEVCRLITRLANKEVYRDCRGYVVTDFTINIFE